MNLATAEELQRLAEVGATIVATPYRHFEPSEIPPRQFLLGRHAVRKFISATVAPGGTGKTNNQLAEMAGYVAGRDIFNENHSGSGRAWYLGLEDPLDEYHRRLSAIVQHHDLPVRDLEGGLFLDSGREQNFVIAREQRGGVVIADPIVAAIIRNIRENEISYLSVDPFIASHTVRENDNGMIEQVVRVWARIADETGAAIDLVHHVRKGTGATGQEPSADDARGARALVDKARSVRLLTTMTKDEALKAGIEERRRYYRITNGKANLFLPPEEGTWRQLVSVSLGNGKGVPDDIVGVAAAWRWPNPLAGLSVRDLDAVQAKVAAGNWRENAQAKDWVGHAVADVLGLDLTDPHVKASVKGMLAVWTKNGALKVETRHDPQRRDQRNFVVVGNVA